MSAMTEQFERDVAAIEPDMPVTFEWKGFSFVGQKDESRVSLRMMEAGYDNQRRTNLVVRVSVFGVHGIPTKKSTPITLDGLEWAIEGEVSKSQDGVTVDLPLVQSN